MRKTIFLIGVLSLSLLYGCKTQKETQNCSNITPKLLGIKEKVKLISEPSNRFKGFCKVILVNGLASQGVWMTPDGKYVIPQIIDRELKKAIEVDVSKYQKLSKDELKKLDEHVSFSYNPSGNKTDKYVYLITDPQCPFCHMTEPIIENWAKQNNVEIRVVLFPLELPNGQSLHPGSFKKSTELLCDIKNKKLSGTQAWQELVNDYNSKAPAKACSDAEQTIKSNIQFLTQDLKVGGTPTLIGMNGKAIIGSPSSEKELNKLIS